MTNPAGEGPTNPDLRMPFVEGESLHDRLTREKQLPIADAVRIELHNTVRHEVVIPQSAGTL